MSKVTNTDSENLIQKALDMGWDRSGFTEAECAVNAETHDAAYDYAKIYLSQFDSEESANGCACVHSDASTCLRRRYHIDIEENDCPDEECQCSCHDSEEDY